MKKFFIPCKGNKYRPYLLGKSAISLYSIILILVNSFGGLIGIPQAYASAITSPSIIALTNQARSSYGLNTLANNGKLEAAALAKANNMFELQYWDHFGPNGESPWQFIKAAGYNYVYAGENLARGFRTSEGVHEAWMASPTHKANIVGANYADIGVSVVTGVLEGSQTILVVQMFGSLNMSQSLPPVTVPDTSEESEPDTYTPTESGQIKAIMIKEPKTGDLLNDSAVNVKGEVSNVTGNYEVEVYDKGESVGSTETISSEKWEFDKGSDWEEGNHEIEAKIAGTTVTSEEVGFSIDSDPPEIDEESIVVVHSEDSFTVSFSIDEEIGDAILVTGDQSVELVKDEEGNLIANISKEDIGGSVQLVVSDVLGNSVAIDVSEYFLEGSQTENVRPGFAAFINSISIPDKVNLLIAFVIFTLLCIEIYVYWKKDKLRDIANDLFALGFWWLLLVVGITTGFAGFVN